MTRPLFIVLTILVFPVAFFGCSEEKAKEVVVIENTTIYHRPDCHLVTMAKTETMTLARAKSQHLKPCPLCKPDTI
jgi:methylphosphotriester-DNA--protein-cysteine methyltransferase